MILYDNQKSINKMGEEESTILLEDSGESAISDQRACGETSEHMGSNATKKIAPQ